MCVCVHLCLHLTFFFPRVDSINKPFSSPAPSQKMSILP